MGWTLPPGWFHVACPECDSWWREAPGVSLDYMFREQAEHRALAHPAVSSTGNPTTEGKTDE